MLLRVRSAFLALRFISSPIINSRLFSSSVNSLLPDISRISRRRRISILRVSEGERSGLSARALMCLIVSNSFLSREPSFNDFVMSSTIFSNAAFFAVFSSRIFLKRDSNRC